MLVVAQGLVMAGKKPTRRSIPSRGTPKVHDSETMALAMAKLESSGLTAEDGEKLGLLYLDAADTAKLCPVFRPLPAIRIPYWGLDGSLLSPWPALPQFYRVRYLKDEGGFASLTTKKALRYVQPADSGVCAYFPRLLEGWEKVAADPAIPILITEGEFKAAKACKEGYPTIGLGGVWNFRSASAGVPFLPELAAVEWRRRRVHIVFDSDFRRNAQVCLALNALAEELKRRGAFPSFVSLPDPASGDGKVGLDDYLIVEGRKGLEALVREAQDLTLAQPLWQLNEQICYVFNPGLVIDLETETRLAPAALAAHAYASADAYERRVGDAGEVSLKRVSAAAAWLKWPFRRQVGKITYLPGQPRFVEGELYNSWLGWGCEPKAGDVAPFLALIDHLFTGAESAARDWFLDWCAYPLQFPGVKMFSSVLIHGVEHGTGKSLIGYTLGLIYGKNFTEISAGNLQSGFNEWAENKQFVMGDDVTGTDKRGDNDMLKKLITQKELRVNVKFVPSYVVPDSINYFFNSNHPDAFFLEDGDRRFFIHEVTAKPLTDEFYTSYLAWRDHDDGVEHVFDWLLKRKLNGFNPSARALMTASKARMTEDTKSDLGSWVSRLKADPDSVLRMGDAALVGALFTTRQLLELYDPVGKTKVTAPGIGRELKKAGIRQVCDGVRLRVAGDNDHYFALRDIDRWLKASAVECTKHIEVALRTPVVAPKKY